MGPQLRHARDPNVNLLGFAGLEIIKIDSSELLDDNRPGPALAYLKSSPSFLSTGVMRFDLVS